MKTNQAWAPDNLSIDDTEVASGAKTESEPEVAQGLGKIRV